MEKLQGGVGRGWRRREGGGSGEMSSTGCCGVKKQKLSGLSYSSSSSSSSRAICCPTPGSTSTNHPSNGHRFRGGEAMEEEEYGSAVARGLRNKVVCPEMIVFCFDILHHFLHGTEHTYTPKFPNDQFPLFVTWKMGSERKLRGCIGTFNSTSLHHGLREYAITSACKDSRFSPITSEEFSRLHCSVSLLMDFEVAEHYLDWEIGVHGIRIEFTTEKGAKKAATYLPEVAVEQGWNQIQTIDSLLRKGGFRGSITPDIRASVCIVRFQSDKLSVSFAEYVAHKQNRHTSSPSRPGGGGSTQNGYANGHSDPHSTNRSPNRDSSANSSSSSSSRTHRLFPSLPGRDHRHSSNRPSGRDTRGNSAAAHRNHFGSNHQQSGGHLSYNHSGSSTASSSTNSSSSSSNASSSNPPPPSRYTPLLNQPSTLYSNPPSQHNP